MTRLSLLVSVCCCFAITASCADRKDLFGNDKRSIIDPANQASRDDYKNVLNAESYKTPDGQPIKPGEPPIPDLAEILAAPQPPRIGQSQLVSVSVTPNVPLQDVLFELARQAGQDIEVDANIAGGVSFIAKDRPFNEVVERLADLAGLRYSVKNGVLRIERDEPYIQIYPLDFLNVTRDSNNNVNINTSVLSSGSGGSGGSGGGSSGGLNSGSTSTITSKSESDFWKQFESAIEKILTYQPATRVSQNSMPTQEVAVSAQGGGGNISTVPSAEPGGAPVQQSSSNSSAGGSGMKPFFVLNKQASTLTVSATGKQHELLQRFIRKMQSNASAQVLIEAKIVEVTLKDEYQSGIDWSQLGGTSLGGAFTFGAVADTGNVATLTLQKNDILRRGIDLDLAVKFAEVFGTTRTLSSPRLHAINNQQSVLTFAENRVFFELSIDSTTSTSTVGPTTTVTVESTIRTIPVGIIMTLQPSINLDTNEVTLNVRPTLSRVVDEVSDPAVTFAAAQANTDIESKIPVVEVRELDSILKVKSGDVMVIGGLMEDKNIDTERGVPHVSTVPVLGELFKGVDQSRNVKELVIFIRATIVGSTGDATPADQGVYKKFMQDPRPLTF